MFPYNIRAMQEASMRYSVMHDGIPVGFVDLESGELVAGRLAPLPTIDSLRGTLRAGSEALLALGFFGAATEAGQNGSGTALRAAAALRFDLQDERGALVPTTFVNVIDAPDGGLVVLARFGHDHAAVGAAVHPTPHAGSGHERPPDNEQR
jgi:hypothetical protein